MTAVALRGGIVRPTAPEGTMLLTAGEAGKLLNAGAGRVRFLESCGFITAVPTDRGPAYREDEVLELRDAVRPPVRWLKPGQAAEKLGVGTETLAGYARQGLVQRNAQGLYDASSVDALAEERAAAKAARKAALDAAKAARAAAAASRRKAAKAARARTD